VLVAVRIKMLDLCFSVFD